MSELRDLPSVDNLIQTAQMADLIRLYGRGSTLDALRAALDRARRRFRAGDPLPDRKMLLAWARQNVESWVAPTLRPVINASGVIIHTNLGRSPLSEETIGAIKQVAIVYSNLEYDLEEGRRGSRLVHAESVLTHLLGVEAALMVNNNAAAVLLALAALASGDRVVIARSQLVEIGGGFRVPDVMKQSGAKLVEVGTTNRVHLRDYKQAIAEEPIKLIMHAHRSNFDIVGFTAEPAWEDVAAVAHAADIPVLDDLGSGALLDTAAYRLAHEPTVQESLAAGSDLVCFSGDKLVGGPQAGIIVGRADLIAKIKEHPLARAVRADKMALAGLSATLTHYLKGEAEEEIPVWRMIAARPSQLESRAHSWAASLEGADVTPGESTVGGGSLPGESLPTSLLSLDVPHPDRFMQRLRKFDPAIIGRIQDEKAVFDPRTVLPEQDESLLQELRQALRETNL